MTIRKPRGRTVAWTALLTGIGVSVSANVAHAQPNIGARLLSAFFPLSLAAALEVLARVSWPTGWVWALVPRAGTAVVALVAAIVSYSHLHDLLLRYQESRLVAIAGPLAVDGLATVGALAILAIARAPVPAHATAAIVPDLIDPVTGGPDLTVTAEAVPHSDHSNMESLTDQPSPARTPDLTPVPLGQAVPEPDEAQAAADTGAPPDPYLPAALVIAMDLGPDLTRASLADELRSRGYPVATNRAGRLLAAIRSIA